jgi:ATP-dependent helicase YprA (DUF1998 family)
MDVFKLRDDVIHDYAEYVRSFVRIREPRLRRFVDDSLTDQALWPQPLIQMNPSFESGGWIDELVDAGVLHQKSKDVFRVKTESDPRGIPMRLHRHQVDAIREAQARRNYVLTTGTGSGSRDNPEMFAAYLSHRFDIMTERQHALLRMRLDGPPLP